MTMSRRRRTRSRIPELNLRAKSFAGQESLQQEVEGYLDRFLRPHLYRERVILRIVVGKGINSSTYIQGTNPLRHYTERYLRRLGLAYRNGQLWEGQEGVIIVEW